MLHTNADRQYTTWASSGGTCGNTIVTVTVIAVNRPAFPVCNPVVSLRPTAPIWWRGFYGAGDG